MNFLPVKEAITVGENSPVDDNYDRRRHHRLCYRRRQWFGQKTDERALNQIAKMVI